MNTRSCALSGLGVATRIWGFAGGCSLGLCRARGCTGTACVPVVGRPSVLAVGFDSTRSSSSVGL